jgi:hypothetical protein
MEGELEIEIQGTREEINSNLGTFKRGIVRDN